MASSHRVPTRPPPPAFLSAAPLLAARPRGPPSLSRARAPPAATRWPTTRALASAPPPPSPSPLPSPAPQMHAPTPLLGRRALAAALHRAQGARFVVLYCRAQWCRTCGTLAVRVARIAEERAAAAAAAGTPGLVWLSLDIVEEENRTLAAEMGADMLPTLMFFHPVEAGAGGGVDLDGRIPGADDESQAEADRALLRAQVERKFMAGPFGHNRLNQNLDLALSGSSQVR